MKKELDPTIKAMAGMSKFFILCLSYFMYISSSIKKELDPTIKAMAGM